MGLCFQITEMHVIRQTKIAILDILIQLPFNVDSSLSTEKTAI